MPKIVRVGAGIRVVASWGHGGSHCDRIGCRRVSEVYDAKLHAKLCFPCLSEIEGGGMTAQQGALILAFIKAVAVFTIIATVVLRM
jgi:hypothetical protein